MKATKYIFPAAFLAVVSFTMCDYVTDPKDVEDIVIIEDSTKRTVLIEEWTGHTCIACPVAARKLDTLETVYGERFISIAIHDDYFAEPCFETGPHFQPPCATNPTAFNEDFRCATGLSYSAAHPLGPTSPPQGMVNRRIRGGSEIISVGYWASLTDSLVNLDAAATMHIDHTYNNSNRNVNVTVWGTWLSTYTGTINVAIMLTESGMIGWQTDGPTACDSAWEFKHVLRECLNTPGSVTGTQILNGPAAQGSTYTYTLPAAYVLPAAFNENGCHLVAMIYDMTTGEVLQAKDVELTP